MKSKSAIEPSFEQNITLAEILDQDSLQRVCMTYASMYQTGVVMVDNHRHVLVDIPAQFPLCRRIGDHPAGPRICGMFEEVLNIHDLEITDQPVTRSCRCGLQYQVLAIRHQQCLLGCMAFGPFRPENMVVLDTQLSDLLISSDTDHDAHVLKLALTDLLKMETFSQARVKQAMRAFGEVLSVIIQNGYARHLTAQIHIAAIQDAYNELTEKNHKLAESLEKLKELDKLKSNFLATVSHELRTPLTSIMGYSEMLLDGLAGDFNQEQHEYLQIIMDKSEQLLQIITKVLDVSKIEAGNIQLICERLNFPELLEQVVKTMMAQAQQKGIMLSYFAMDTLPLVWVDRGKIQQVMTHLVHNAIKFTPRGGKVEVCVEEGQLRCPGKTDGAMPRASTILIHIQETGIGIPEKSRDKIFEAFYQVDSSSTREHDGTGLGLSIVKNYVEAHGGRVWVESIERLGTTFFVLLPVDPSPATLMSTAPIKRQSTG